MTALESAKAEARRRWRHLTPYRLGVVIGEGSEHAACPYVTARGRSLFAEGLACGREKIGKVGES